MNHAEETEEYCLDVDDDDVDYNYAFLQLIEKAHNSNNPLNDWNGIQHVRLRGSNVECPLYTPLITGFEIRFKVVQDVHVACPNVGSTAHGCEKSSAAMDPDDLSQHQEHRYSTIYLDEVGLNAPWPQSDRVINHEIGHSLGLCDGGPTAPASSLCDAWPWHDDCRDSIMHIYYELIPPWNACFPDAPEWPTHVDIAAVEALVPDGGTGQGGSGGGGGGKAFN